VGSIPPDQQPKSSDRRRASRQSRDRVPGCLIVSGGRQEVFVSDVSPSGAGVISDEAQPVGSAVQLRIGIGPARVPQRCEVVRCDALPDGTFAIGVRFLDAAPRFLAQQRLAG
jgi:hypothetical protein